MNFRKYFQLNTKAEVENKQINLFYSICDLKKTGQKERNDSFRILFQSYLAQTENLDV